VKADHGLTQSQIRCGERISRAAGVGSHLIDVGLRPRWFQGWQPRVRCHRASAVILSLFPALAPSDIGDRNFMLYPLGRRFGADEVPRPRRPVAASKLASSPFPTSFPWIKQRAAGDRIWRPAGAT